MEERFFFSIWTTGLYGYYHMTVTAAAAAVAITTLVRSHARGQLLGLRGGRGGRSKFPPRFKTSGNGVFDSVLVHVSPRSVYNCLVVNSLLSRQLFGE